MYTDCGLICQCGLKPQTNGVMVVILVTVGKGALNTKVSTDRGFNGAEEQGRDRLWVFLEAPFLCRVGCKM